MEKTIFEQMGGTYTQQGDCYLPNLVLPTEKETRPIGVWGQRHLRYLKENFSQVETAMEGLIKGY